MVLERENLVIRGIMDGVAMPERSCHVYEEDTVSYIQYLAVSKLNWFEFLMSLCSLSMSF